MNRRTRTTILAWGGPLTAALVFVRFLVYVTFHPWFSPISLIQSSLLTAVVFGGLLIWFWKQTTKPRFWVFYLCHLALHCIIWGLLFPRALFFQMLTLAISAIVEVMVMAFWYWLTTVEPTAWPW